MTGPALADVEAFRIVGFGFDPETNTAHFDYALDDSYHFRETVEFAGAPFGAHPPGLDRALRLVHLAAGRELLQGGGPRPHSR